MAAHIGHQVNILWPTDVEIIAFHILFCMGSKAKCILLQGWTVYVTIRSAFDYMHYLGET
jgi:hypothetical protein